MKTLHNTSSGITSKLKTVAAIRVRKIAAPIATGYIAQATHSFFWAFGAAAGFLVAGIAGYIFLLGRIEAIAEPS